MGTMGVQIATLSGYRVIATCSEHNFDLVKSYGAEAVFNYKDPKAVDEIKKYTNNDLKLVWDTIALPASAEFCGKVIAQGGHYGNILSQPLPRSLRRQTDILRWAIRPLGEPFEKGGNKIQRRDRVAPDYEFIQKFMLEGERLAC